MAPPDPNLSLIALREASRGLVACKGGGGGAFALLGRFGGKIAQKKIFKMVLGSIGGGFLVFSGWF